MMNAMIKSDKFDKIEGVPDCRRATLQYNSIRFYIIAEHNYNCRV